MLKNKLGTGSVGVVRLGYNKDTNKKYAVKIISKGKCSDMSRIDNEIKVLWFLIIALIILFFLILFSLKETKQIHLWINFLKAMMLLDHPHVAKLEEVLESQSCVSFVMDLCPGGSLYEFMDNSVIYYYFTILYFPL